MCDKRMYFVFTVVLSLGWTSTIVSSSVLMGEAQADPEILLFKPYENTGLDDADTCSIGDNDRLDCFPEPGSNEKDCLARKCCWKPASEQPSSDPGNQGNINVPYCFYPTNANTYSLEGAPVETKSGYSALLSRVTKSRFPADVMTLQLDVMEETDSRIHFKIYDPNVRRYEVPISTPKVSKKAVTSSYVVEFSQNPFGLTITRKSTGTKIFSTFGPLIFADQFLQISSRLASQYVYGLGEHQGPFLQNTAWSQLAFWARDQPPALNVNLYGSHPFYMGFEKDGNAHGVFLLNSNAMDIILQPSPAITYRSIGGILDFYVFLGPTPDAVVEQYSAVIGRSFLPPYWTLGFHLCRWGYNSTKEMKKVIKRMEDAGFPYDTQWNDIDYMQNHLDWTYDKDRFSGLDGVVKDLHDSGKHYVMIVDPGISSTQPKGSYLPYDDGVKRNIFIKDSSGTSDIAGWVWPGKTVFPDFTHPDSVDYWTTHAAAFHHQIPYDGLWTDMNEPSNFFFGSTKGCPGNSSLDKPPYVPGILGGRLPDRTLCPSAKQHASDHYNVHSLYGLTEVIATQKALSKISPGQRPFVLSRSTFPSSGQYGAHWLGDNAARWDHMYYSIPGTLNFQLFGIPLVGADICGFGGETTEELCTRWMQLGSFYPFMRNHNYLNAKAQDPAAFSPTAQASMKKAMKIRYKMLPFLYTLFHRSHTNGTAVARPLSFQYPKDVVTYSIDKQFLWGSNLLITPVLEQGATSVKAYFPSDVWYDYYNMSRIEHLGWVTLDAPLDKINLHLRGGSITPMQEPATTTTHTRKNPYSLLVALGGSDNSAEGDLYLDDGLSKGVLEDGRYSYIIFTASKKGLKSTILMSGYQPEALLTEIQVLGLAHRPATVTMVNQDNQHLQYSYNQDTKVLTVYLDNLDLLKPLDLQWS